MFFKSNANMPYLDDEPNKPSTQSELTKTAAGSNFVYDITQSINTNNQHNQ